MTDLDLSRFEWFDVGPTPPDMAVHVSDSGGFTFNSAAREKLPEHIRVGALEDGRTLCVQAAENSTYIIPKNGRVKIPKLQEKLKAAGVILPAKYVFRQEGGCLIGELVPPGPGKPGSSRRRAAAKRPRNISRSAEEHILEGLSNGGLR